MYDLLNIIKDYLINGIVNITQCESLLHISPYFHWVLLSLIVCMIMHVLNYISRCIYWDNGYQHTLFCNWIEDRSMKYWVLFADIIGILIGPIGFTLLVIGLMISCVHLIYSLFGEEFLLFNC